MGTYLNPGNSAFARNLRGTYVDKTGLIAVVNNTIDTPMNLTCISRPRRFGKTYAAQMLCAYYDKSVDSHSLFDHLSIGKTDSYERHLNAYDLIYVDMTNIISKTKPEAFVPFLTKAITEELLATYPIARADNAFDDVLLSVVAHTGGKFIMIIDEWDAPIRELSEKAADEYLLFLRMLFKGSATTDKLFAAVYMTGILPIKKTKLQSVLSNFKEYTMLRPGRFSEYVGFTEEEVKQLCATHGMDFSKMKLWYDGYECKGVGTVFNPYSVMSAFSDGDFDSYWSKSSAADDLLNFIRWDVDGLRKAIIELMGGVEVEIDTVGYNNDLSYTTRDAALTMFVHLGYLSYQQDRHTVQIPNEEIRLAFARALKQATNEVWL